MSLTPIWRGLSAEGAWTVAMIGWPMSCGTSVKEFAGHLGESQGWIESQLERLQRELVRSSGVATPVDESETTPGPHRQRI